MLFQHIRGDCIVRRDVAVDCDPLPLGAAGGGGRAGVRDARHARARAPQRARAHQAGLYSGDIH